MPDSSPLVSVIMPTMDRPHLLGRAIRSVLAQSFQDFEVWVVDGSPAGSAAPVVEGFADPRLHYMRRPARGVNDARNEGIRRSRGSLIAFLDDDDEWLPEKLERQVELLGRSGASVGGAFVSYRYINPAKGVSKVVSIFEHRSLIEPKSAGPSSATVIRRGVFDDVGLFDEEMVGADDWEMWLKISEKYRFAFVPAVLMNYYVTKGNLSSDRLRQLRAMQTMLRKHPRLQQSRRFMAHYYSVMGQFLCGQGLMARGRRYLLSSHLSNRGLYPLLLLVLSALGARPFNNILASMGDTGLSLRLERLIEMMG